MVKRRQHHLVLELYPKFDELNRVPNVVRSRSLQDTPYSDVFNISENLWRGSYPLN
jgi:hypothetical protein